MDQLLLQAGQLARRGLAPLDGYANFTGKYAMCYKTYRKDRRIKAMITPQQLVGKIGTELDKSIRSASPYYDSSDIVFRCIVQSLASLQEHIVKCFNS